MPSREDRAAEGPEASRPAWTRPGADIHAGTGGAPGLARRVLAGHARWVRRPISQPRAGSVSGAGSEPIAEPRPPADPAAASQPTSHSISATSAAFALASAGADTDTTTAAAAARAKPAAARPLRHS
jgi:hypothetical protein